MPWHRFTGSFVRAALWRIFGRIGSPQPHLPKIYWASQRRERFQGVLEKAPQNLRKHRAATRAVKQVMQRGFLLLERTETFPFRYHFQNLGFFERFLRTAWKESFVRPSVYRRLQMVQRRSRSGHIVVVEPLRLNILRKRWPPAEGVQEPQRERSGAIGSGKSGIDRVLATIRKRRR